MAAEKLIFDGERVDDTGFGGLKLIQKPEEFCYGVDAVILADFAARCDGNIDDLIGINSISIFTVDNPAGIYGQIEFTQGLLLRGFTGACRGEEPLSEEDFTGYEKSQPVIVFPKYGIRYHVKTCRYVEREYDGQEYRLEMELEDAKLKGYTACLICGGGENE